jgi:hypothetical protein
MTEDKRRNDTPCLFYEDGMTPEGMVSVSQIGTFLACRRRWEYAYREGLRQRRERDYLTVGKLCHAGMEAAMRRRWECAVEGWDHEFADLQSDGRSAIIEMFNDYMSVTDFLDEERPEQYELCDRALDVFDEALEEFDPLRWLPVTVVRDNVSIPALELHFYVPCAGSEGLHGYIDAILEDQDTGQVWCVDYKFRRTLAADDDERFNLQNAVYMMACRQMWIDVAGTMTWQHYNTPSAVPKFNRDGSVSRSKIRCTWTRYRRFLEEAGLDPADYAEMADKLADVEMCRATKEIRSDDMVNRVWHFVVVDATREIALARRSGRALTPSMDPWTCRLCSFQSLCQAELRGYDADYIRETEYTLRSHRQ